MDGDLGGADREAEVRAHELEAVMRERDAPLALNGLRRRAAVADDEDPPPLDGVRQLAAQELTRLLNCDPEKRLAVLRDVFRFYDGAEHLDPKHYPALLGFGAAAAIAEELRQARAESAALRARVAELEASVDGEEFITAADAARRRGMHPVTVQSMIRRGELRAKKHGNCYMVRVSHVESIPKRPAGRPKRGVSDG
jgi:hypothetical protein